LPFVTVFNGSSGIDATIAAPEVLAAFPDSTPDGSKDALSNAAPATASTPAPGANDPTATAKSPCYRIEATINFSNGRRTASEVVFALGDKVEPYRVLSWQDDVEPRGRAPRRRGL
jgi:general secretion pathway protein K